MSGSGFDRFPVAPKGVYIAGPMRGHDGFNFPAFFRAEAEVRKVWPTAAVYNPARADVDDFNLSYLMLKDPTGLEAGRWLVENYTPTDLRGSLRQDLGFICERTEVVIALPGWEGSKGATAEVATAKALGIPVMLSELPVEDGHDPSVVDWQAILDRALGYQQAGADFEVKGDGEVRVVSETGGEKGSKLAAFDQISPEIERLVAEHFGKGARKYSAHNFRKGYPWSLSYSALRRHLAAFWGGEEYDNHLPSCPDGCTDHTGSLHIVAVIWHAMVLAEFFLHHKEFDDRYVYSN